MLFDKIEKFGLGSVISRFLRIRSLTVSRKSESFFFSRESRLWKCIEFIFKSWIIHIQTRHFSIQRIFRKNISYVTRSLLSIWPERISPSGWLRSMEYRPIISIQKINIFTKISVHLRPSHKKQENDDRKYKSQDGFQKFSEKTHEKNIQSKTSVKIYTLVHKYQQKIWNSWNRLDLTKPIKNSILRHKKIVHTKSYIKTIFTTCIFLPTYDVAMKKFLLTLGLVGIF